MPTYFIISPFESVMEGRGTRNVILARTLMEHGHRVIFVTTDFSHQDKVKFRQKELSRAVATEPYEQKVLSIPLYKDNISIRRVFVHLVLAAKLFRYLKKNCCKGDLLLTSSIPPEIVLVVSTIAVQKDAKMWLDARDVWPDAFPMTQRKIMRRLFQVYCDFLYSRSVANAEAVSYISERISTWVFRYMAGRPLAIKMLVPLGFDAQRWKKRKDSRKNSTKLRLCYVGSLEHQCPLDVILEAVKKENTVELIVIGSGSRLAHYRTLADPNVVTFSGRLEPKRVSEILADCDVGVLPIVYSQGLPNKFFDYLGAGLPILHIGESEAGEIVAARGLGWNVPFEVDAISRTLGQLKQQLEVRRETVLKVRKEYSKDNIYPMWIEQLEKFANA